MTILTPIDAATTEPEGDADFSSAKRLADAALPNILMQRTRPRS